MTAIETLVEHGALKGQAIAALAGNSMHLAAVGEALAFALCFLEVSDSEATS